MLFRVEDSLCPIWGDIAIAGSDCAITIQGGTAPHIGAVVLAVPHRSINGDGTSATVSRLSVTAHRDDEFAAAVAKRIAARLNCVVACSCGIHIDNAAPTDLAHIMDLIDKVTASALTLLEENAEEE